MSDFSIRGGTQPIPHHMLAHDVVSEPGSSDVDIVNRTTAIPAETLVATDGTTVTGDGSGINPLTAQDGSIAVAVDGTTIGGDGKVGDALHVIAAGVAPELADLVAVATDGVTIVGNGTTGDPLIASASAGTTIYYNVKAAPYNATGNGVTNDTNSILAAFAAASAVGGGTIYFPEPSAFYLVSEHGTSQRCLAVPADVCLLGQSQDVTIGLAGSQRDGVIMVYVDQNCNNVQIGQLTLDGNKSGQGDDDQHRDGIFFFKCQNGYVHDVTVQNFTGSGVAPNENTSYITCERVLVTGCDWMGFVIGDAGGQNQITLRECWAIGNAGGIHIETSVLSQHLLFEHCYCDATTGNAALNILGGTGSANWVTDVTAFDCTVSGYVQISSASDVKLIGCTVTNADASAGSPPNEHCAVRVTNDASDVLVAWNTIVQQAAGTAPQAVIVAGNSNNDLSGIKIWDNEIVVLGSAQDGILVQQGVRSCRIERNRITGNSTLGAGFYGVNVNAKVAPSIGVVIVNDNTITDFPIGIGAQSGSSALHIADLQTCRNTFQQVSLAMTAGMSLDLDGHHAVQQSECMGNTLVGFSTMFATYPNVPMLIGGNRGGVEFLSVATSPAGSVTAPIGSQAVQRDNGTTWINATGASGGWHSVNVT